MDVMRLARPTYPRLSSTEAWIGPPPTDPYPERGERPRKPLTRHNTVLSSRFLIVLALGAIYLIWGSTYLAIRIAIETLPPFLMAGVRFLLVGGILFIWARLRGNGTASKGVWFACSLSGLLMFLGGNGTVVWAEQFVPSGLVALLVATVPLWIVLQDWASGRGPAPGPGLLIGILFGFGGVALLVSGSEIAVPGRGPFLGGVVVLFGAACWSMGSLVSRYGPKPPSAPLGIGIQNLAGGGALLLLALFRGEVAALDPGKVSAASILAFFYLVVFGSIVGFSTYIWLLRNTTPAVASTYAYVNPIVALVLGWALAGEPFSPRTGVAAFVILSSVVIITTQRTGGIPPPKRIRPA
jgi:drug/metabolite transporter (DMT)-like permease